MAKKFENPSKEENERLEALMNKVENDERYPDVEVPADFHEKLAKQIEEYKKQERVEENARVLLSDEDKEALRIGREIIEKEKRNTPYRRRKKKAYLLVAAVLILTLAFGVIGVGARGNIVEFIADLFGGTNREKINTSSDETRITTELSEEEQAYEDVEGLFDTSVVKINLIQENLEFESINVDKALERADFRYQHEEGALYYHIYRNHSNNSHSLTKEEVEGDFEVSHKLMNFIVKEEENIETGVMEYSTTFTHNNLSYIVKSEVSRSDFEEILKNLVFF